MLAMASTCFAHPVNLSNLEERVQALDEQAISDYQRGDFATSVSTYEELLDTVDLALLPGRATSIQYNVACSAALAGRSARAIEALAAAVDAGWSNLEHLAGDTDLDSIRNTAGFRELVARMERERALETRVWGGQVLQTAYRENIPVEEKIASLSSLWMEAKLNFAFFDQVPDLDWDAEYLSALPRVMATTSTRDLYAILREFVAKLEDGHTNVYYPNELRGEVYSSPAIRTSLVEDRVVVVEILNSAITSLVVGDEIVSIDGMPVKTYVSERVTPYVCASTPQDHNRRAYGRELLQGSRETPVVLEVLDALGERRTVTLERGRKRTTSMPHTESRMLGDIGYLAINTFSGEAPVDSLVALAMEELRGARGLVIDIRENGGGSSGWWVMGYLMDEYEVTNWATREYRAVHRAWGRSQTWLRQTGGTLGGQSESTRFDGPVVLLTSRRTFSAAEDLAAVFKWSGRGKIVGETTGGSTGQPLSVRLPGGGSAQICAKRDTYPDGSEFVGYGIHPDIDGPRTVEGVRAGRDEVLEVALEVLR
jgi:C-terminal processing protease CtpA/Prc